MNTARSTRRNQRRRERRRTQKSASQANAPATTGHNSTPRPLEPLTAVALVCASRDGLATLALHISAFIDPARSPRWTVERVCQQGHLRLLQRCLDANIDARKPELYRSHMFSLALMHAATKDQDIALIECLHAYCPSGFASLGMSAAALFGKLHVIQWLATHHASSIVWSSLFALAAASRGHLEVLQWLATKYRPGRERSRQIIEDAAKSGHFATVKWLFEVADRDNIEITANQCSAILGAACAGGSLDTVMYLFDGRGYRSFARSNCISSAAASGNLELVQWLFAQGYRNLTDSNLYGAVEKGQIDLVRWMLNNWDSMDGATADSFEAIYADTDEDFFDIGAEGIWTAKEDIIAYSVSYAGFEITQMIYGLKPEVFTVELLSKKLRSAAIVGDLEFIQWLFKIVQAIGGWSSDALASDAYRSITDAAWSGHLEVVQWLFANLRTLVLNPAAVEQSAVITAAGSGHVDVVKWLHANRSRDEPARYRISIAALHGDLELVQWMLQNAECDESASSVLELAAASSNLAMLQWLHEYFRFDPSSRHSYAVREAVRKNHVHIAKWLHEQGYGGWSADLLDMATSLEMIEWLHFNRPEMGWTTDVMDNAAARGDFDTLLFLHEHRSEGCTVNAAVRAQRNNYMLIVQWLFETYPRIVTRETMIGGFGDGVPLFVEWFWAPQMTGLMRPIDGEVVSE